MSMREGACDAENPYFVFSSDFRMRLNRARWNRLFGCAKKKIAAEGQVQTQAEQNVWRPCAGDAAAVGSIWSRGAKVPVEHQ